LARADEGLKLFRAEFEKRFNRRCAGTNFLNESSGMMGIGVVSVFGVVIQQARKIKTAAGDQH
jgi:hypothetical protein